MALMPRRPAGAVDLWSVDDDRVQADRVLARDLAKAERDYEALGQRHDATERPLEFPIRDAASFLGVSISSVRLWSDAGTLKCYRTPGGQRRYNASELEAFASELRELVARENAT
jgi:excisionase family DNA binding protein